MMDFTNGLSFLGDGLAGRDMFREDLEWRIISTPQLPLSIIFIHVRNLRELGAALGFESEYTILHQVVERTRNTFSGSEFLAKLSDFEFAILWPAYEHGQTLEGYIEDLHRVLLQPMVVHGTQVDLDVCFASSRYPQDGSDAVTLMQHASMALESTRQTAGTYYRSSSQKTVAAAPTLMPFHFSAHTIYDVVAKRDRGMHIKLHQSIVQEYNDVTKSLQYMETLFRNALVYYKQWLQQTGNTTEDLFLMMPLLQTQHLGNELVEMLITICYEQKVDREAVVLQWSDIDFIGKLGRENQELILALHEAGFGLAYAALRNEQWALQDLLEYPFNIFLVNDAVVQQLTNQTPSRKDRLVRAILRSCVEAKLFVIADNWQESPSVGTVSNLIQGVSCAKGLPLHTHANV